MANAQKRAVKTPKSLVSGANAGNRYRANHCSAAAVTPGQSRSVFCVLAAVTPGQSRSVLCVLGRLGLVHHFPLSFTERLYWIHLGCAPRRNRGRDESDGDENERHQTESLEIGRGHFMEES